MSKVSLIWSRKNVLKLFSLLYIKDNNIDLASYSHHYLMFFILKIYIFGFLFFPPSVPHCIVTSNLRYELMAAGARLGQEDKKKGCPFCFESTRHFICLHEWGKDFFVIALVCFFIYFLQKRLFKFFFHFIFFDKLMMPGCRVNKKHSH